MSNKAQRVGLRGPSVQHEVKPNVVWCLETLLYYPYTWVQEDDCNWGGGGANPFIMLHVMLKNYDTISLKKISLINSLGIAWKSV